MEAIAAMRAHLAAACRISVLVPAFRCPIICSSNRCASAISFICPPSVLTRLGFIRAIVRFDLLPPHHPEEMLSMLVIVLRFHRIAAQEGCLRKRNIALVLSSSIRQDIAGPTSEC